MYLTALLLACVAWLASADDGCICQVSHSRARRGANWGMNYAGARIDAQEMRIAGLARSIDELSEKVNADDAAEYRHVVHELGRRVESIEGWLIMKSYNVVESLLYALVTSLYVRQCVCG